VELSYFDNSGVYAIVSPPFRTNEKGDKSGDLSPSTQWILFFFQKQQMGMISAMSFRKCGTPPPFGLWVGRKIHSQDYGMGSQGRGGV
jgi:hypothetical protein